MRRKVYSLFSIAGMTLVGLASTALLHAGSAAATGLHPMDDIAARVTAFAGRPGRVDARMLLPACPQPALAMAGSDAVRVMCVAPAWTVFVPLDGQGMQQSAGQRGQDGPAIRRGDHVQVAADGPGFAVTLDAVAERDSADGRVWLRSESGRRFQAQVAADGRVMLGAKTAW